MEIYKLKEYLELYGAGSQWFKKVEILETILERGSYTYRAKLGIKNNILGFKSSNILTKLKKDFGLFLSLKELFPDDSEFEFMFSEKLVSTYELDVHIIDTANYWGGLGDLSGSACSKGNPKEIFKNLDKAAKVWDKSSEDADKKSVFKKYGIYGNFGINGLSSKFQKVYFNHDHKSKELYNGELDYNYNYFLIQNDDRKYFMNIKVLEHVSEINIRTSKKYLIKDKKGLFGYKTHVR